MSWTFEKKKHNFLFSQNQLTPVSKTAYRECLGKLDLQYGKLLVRS